MITKAIEKWNDFYTKDVVLGIDVGIEGIGIWLRKGSRVLWAGTFLTSIPEAAPLASRRLKRSARRARQSRKHRERLLREFCARHQLPWVEINTNPFKLRLRALTAEKGLASKEALVICLRHIIRHRGFDYHRTRAEEGGYPWGGELEAKKALQWVETTCCNKELAEDLVFEVNNSGWSEKDISAFKEGLAGAVARYNEDPILKRLREHFGEKPHLRPPARKANFPRELVWDHLEKICRRHTHFLGGQTGLEKALAELKAILDYHRKPPGALAERRVKDCPYAPRLFDGENLKCATNQNEWVRRFKLAEFLATRTFVAQGGTRHTASHEVFGKLLEILNADISALAKKTERPKFGKKDFASACGMKLASDKDSHNKDYFEQLRDLVATRLSALKGRAAMSARAAEHFYKLASGSPGDWDSAVEKLKTYFDWRRDTERGFGLYPQVEFLLGKWSVEKGKAVVPGKLRQIMARAEVRAALGGKAVPDYVVIECIGDIPRNQKEARELRSEQQARREYKEQRFAQYKLPEKANEADRKRVLLFEQQGGKCPYTGEDLKHPLAKDLQIDHIFPRERGGISEMANLVLTKGATNLAKGKRTPYEVRDKFPEAFALAGKMQWNKAKLALFQRTEADCPDWRNVTRVAQLARQLRDEAARWLGIKGDPVEMSRRIGTPTGFLTKVCRDSWQEHLPEKNRGNYRHHMWDAAVLSHIPPGAGMNLVNYGGIFYYRRASEGGEIALSAMEAAAPDVLAFEKKTADRCLVIKPRQKKSKKSRMEETIYGMDEQGQLWTRKPITKDGAPVKGVEKALEVAGFPDAPKPLLARKLVEKWLGNPAEPLRLANKTKVESVPVIAAKESPTVLVPHRNREGMVIGVKKAKEGFLRYEIWQAPGTDKRGKPIFQRRLIPHPRNLAGLVNRGFHWRQKPGAMPAELAGKVVGQTGAFKANINGDATLRQQICGPLAPYSKKIGDLTKGDLVRLPLDANGELCSPEQKVFVLMWFRITALNSNGQVEMQAAEYKDKSATPLHNLERDAICFAPSAPSVLAFIIQKCKWNG